MRVAINGFGRIGRTILRQILVQPGHPDVDVVALNDIAPLDSCAYLFRYDSVFGPYPGEVRGEDGALVVDTRRIPFRAEPDITALDLSDVDVLIECTGKANTREVAGLGLKAGAKNVLISGPSDAADITLVLGANDHLLTDQRVVSNASCTTNALAPLLRVLHEDLGVAQGHMTTIHCYTGSQPMVDAPRASHARSRAGAVSMIPTTTSATRLVGEILPQLKDRISGAAVRVPTLSVSAVDLVLQLDKLPEKGLNAYLKERFVGSNLIGFVGDSAVSTDMRGRSESVVIALPETIEKGTDQVRLFGWYDNEWGYSARVIELARGMVARDG
ncbi:MAG: glyceraldehyde 3-phosphate dehydrogenase NAD-binding domain-containing protein [Pseudomonadota bacterium]